MNGLSPIERLACGIARIREIEAQATSGAKIAGAPEAAIFSDIEALAVQALIYLGGLRGHIKEGK